MLGIDQGSAPVEAIRMAMFKYQPAIDLLRKTLEHSYPHKKQKIMEVGNKVLTKGQIDEPADLQHLLELLDSILNVFQELGQAEVEMRRTMAAKNVGDFLPRGRVLGGLERALQDIANYVDESGEEFSEDEGEAPLEQSLQLEQALSSTAKSPELPSHKTPARQQASRGREQEVADET